MSNLDTTRVLAPVPLTEDRTMVVSSPGGAATMVMPAGGDAMRTQMGGTVTCPICQSTTPSMETYCGDCGYLLASAPPEDVAVAPEEKAPAELVDLNDGRRFRLRAGDNTLGRQGTDVLIADGTISRAHARISVNGSEVIVEDLGSSNGTKVGDLRIGPNQPTVAPAGVILKFGNWRGTLEISGVAASSDQTVLLAPDSAGAAAPAPVETQDISPPEGFLPAVTILRKVSGPSPDIPAWIGTVSVGRRAGNTVVLAGDAYLSSKHALLVGFDDGASLVDVGSTNGTFVNGQRLVKDEFQELAEGDEILLGQTKYRFEFLPPAPQLDNEPEIDEYDMVVTDEAGVNAQYESQDDAESDGE